MGSEEEMTGKGPVVHQESKTFNGEYQLITVFDNPDAKMVVFEAYSLESSEVLDLRYRYAEFDQFFRFNAELMNPNNREGRYHWIIRRLCFASDGSTGRKLALGGRPTEEEPEVPIYTTAKIPTGRMNYNERQRLRDEMERLDMRRNENIEAKRLARERRFIAELEEQKAVMAMRHEARLEKIAVEKKERIELIAEAHQTDKDRKIELLLLDKERSIVIEDIQARRLGREEEVVKECMQKHLSERAEKQKRMQAAAEQKTQIENEIVQNEDAARNVAEKLEERRERQIEVREERIGKKEDAYLGWLESQRAEDLRKAEIVAEKKRDFVKKSVQVREELFREQFAKSAERAAYAEATKPKQPGEKQRIILDTQRHKKKAAKDDKKAALDPVHEQMMAAVAEKKYAAAMQEQRDNRDLAAMKERNRQEAERALEGKERFVQIVKQKEDEARRRKDIREEAWAERVADQNRLKQERARLDGLREMRIRDKEAMRASRLGKAADGGGGEAS